MTNDNSAPSPVEDSSGAEQHKQLSFEELDTTARTIASNMQRQRAGGARIAARAIGIRRSPTEGQPTAAADSTSPSGGTLHKKSTPPDRAVWNFVTRTSLGDVETYLWHRQGSNEFCWRPVGPHWSAEETPADNAE